MSQTLNAVGIMSGTSLDACDFVLIEARVNTKKQIEELRFLDHIQKPLDNQIRAQTWRLIENPKSKVTLAEVATLNLDWANYYGKQLMKICQQKKWKVDIVGLHGQTVYHQGTKLTWQMGSLARVAAITQVPVVGDFRSMDVSMGYQGAPLAPLFHAALLKNKNKLLSIHNLGGISNLTLIQNGQVLAAFDTGPANMPIDTFLIHATQGRIRFDKNGRLAAQGRVDIPLFKKLKRHSYFKKPAPKSAGREQFGGEWLKTQLSKAHKISLNDTCATLTEWVAWSIATAYNQLQPVHGFPESIYFCGGGALNTELLNRVQKYLPQCKVQTTAQLGWPVFAIEGGCFAYLATARYLGYRWNLKNITGNPNLIKLGVVYEV